MQRYIPQFKNVIDKGEKRIQVRVFGPNRWEGSHGHWAGNYSADELEALGVEAIRAAHNLRIGLAQPEVSL